MELDLKRIIDQVGKDKGIGREVIIETLEKAPEGQEDHYERVEKSNPREVGMQVSRGHSTEVS